MAHVGSLLLPLPTVWLVVIVMGWMYPEILLGLVDISSVNYGRVSQGLGLGPCIVVGCLSMNRHIVYSVLRIDTMTRRSTGCHLSLVVISGELVTDEISALRKLTDPGQRLLACETGIVSWRKWLSHTDAYF